MDDFEARYRAIASRDARFDGRFFTGVTSTGIYCRPICPARTPARANVRFFDQAAAAEQAGFRACRRCRPDTSPDAPDWDIRADLAGRALRLIADGVVDREGVDGLAARLAVGPRHLTRVLTDQVGASPRMLARSRRARLARQLIEGSDLPLSEIAFTAGFASIRAFNQTMRALYGAPPSALRRAGGSRGALVLRLAARTPFDGAGALDVLAARAIPGVEQVEHGRSVRAIPAARGTAWVELVPDDGGIDLHVTGEPANLAAVVQAARRTFDLDADPAAIRAVLAADRRLRRAVERAPGVRVPGAFDPFETSVRVILGQQVSVAAASTVAGRVAERAGIALDPPAGPITHRFPTPDRLAAQNLERIGVPGARARAVLAFADAVASGDIVLDGSADPAETAAALGDLPGIGPWTVEMLRARVLRDPDGFPASDLGLRRGAAVLGLPDDPRGLEEAAEAWRPWRAYAAMVLWRASQEA